MVLTFGSLVTLRRQESLESLEIVLKGEQWLGLVALIILLCGYSDLFFGSERRLLLVECRSLYNLLCRMLPALENMVDDKAGSIANPLMNKIIIYNILIKTMFKEIIILMSGLHKLLLDDVFSVDQQEKPKEQYDADGGFFFCFKLAKYFDVEEEDVFSRIRSAIMLRPPFHQVVGDKPDLYGPFWIATSLVVVLIVSSSLLWFFDGQQGSYNYNFVPIASAMIFGIAFVCPYCVSILVKIFGGKMPVVRLMCIYGYSMSSFILPTAFCFIKSNIIQSIVLIIGFLVSTVFLVMNILSIEAQLLQRQKYVIISLLIGVQLILIVTYKFYFFEF